MKFNVMQPMRVITHTHKPSTERSWKRQTEQNSKRYNCNGFMVDWEYIHALELMYRGEIPATKRTEQILEAHRIFTKEIERIEGVEPMKKNTYKYYVMELANVGTATRIEIKKLVDRVDQAKQNLKAAVGELEKARATIELEEAKQNLDSQYPILMADYKAKKSEYEKGVADIMNKKFYINPNDLDEKALKLMERNILTESDLRNMVELYKDNYTMLKTLRDYADKMGSQEAKLIMLDIDRKTMRDNESFDTVCEIFDKHLTTDSTTLKSLEIVSGSIIPGIMARLEDTPADEGMNEGTDNNSSATPMPSLFD